MTYTHGHHESVLRSHTWRTAENSAGYLLPHLRPGLSLLDVGCGPGTITVDLARLVAPGQVIGLDASGEVVAQACGARLRNPKRPTCASRWATSSPCSYDDASFDVVHAHQVLQHLVDPVAALVELRRVLRPGGVLAARDSDYGAFAWAPADPALDRWIELYLAVTARNGHDARIGPSLLGLAHAAGFSDVTVSSTSWTFADPAVAPVVGRPVGRSGPVLPLRRAGRGLRVERRRGACSRSPGPSSTGPRSPDGVFVVPHVEILARR